MSSLTEKDLVSNILFDPLQWKKCWFFFNKC